MKKKKSNSKEFKKVNGKLVQYRNRPPRNYEECIEECMDQGGYRYECEPPCRQMFRPRQRFQNPGFLDCFRRCVDQGNNPQYCYWNCK